MSMEAKEKEAKKMENKYQCYYEIGLIRGRGERSELFIIGVGLNGQIISCRYDGRSIIQYNGHNAEAFALQMTIESDPVWERLNDHFPGGR